MQNTWSQTLRTPGTRRLAEIQFFAPLDRSRHQDTRRSKVADVIKLGANPTEKFPIPSLGVFMCPSSATPTLVLAIISKFYMKR